MSQNEYLRYVKQERQTPSVNDQGNQAEMSRLSTKVGVVDFNLFLPQPGSVAMTQYPTLIQGFTDFSNQFQYGEIQGINAVNLDQVGSKSNSMKQFKKSPQTMKTSKRPLTQGNMRQRHISQ